jgi:hypothetical protein
VRLRDRRDNKSLGQSVVEFSLAIPIFMLVFLAVAEGGYYVVATTIISSATHEGARLGVLGSTSDTVTIRARVVSMAAPIVTVANGDVELDLSSGGSTTVDCDDPCYQARDTGDRLRVRTAYTHIPLVGYVFPGITFPANAEAELLVEGSG